MLPSIKKHETTSIKDIANISQSFVTIFAMVLGGWWTYDSFIRERKKYPHADLELSAQTIFLNNTSTLVRVVTELKNIGSVRLTSSRNIIRIEQLLPLQACENGNKCVAQKVKDITIKSAEGGVRMDLNRFEWPILGKRDYNPGVDIEPGETERADYEFAIPKGTKMVRVYAYFRNDLKMSEGFEVGWSISKLISLSP